MILGKINQPENGLFALISGPAEFPGLPRQIMGIILETLGPNLDQALFNLTARPGGYPEQHLTDTFTGAMQRLMDLTQTFGAPGLSVAVGKANNLGEDKYRLLLANLGDLQIYFQDIDGTFLHTQEQMPNIITANLDSGSRLIFTTPAVRQHLLPGDLAKLIAHMPHHDAAAEQIVLRSLENQAGDKEILIWTARSLSPQGVELIPEADRGIPTSVRLARLNDRLKDVLNRLEPKQPALGRLQLEMAKANLEYWLAHTLRQAVAEKISPVLSPGDIIHLPDHPEPHVVHAYNPEDESYVIRQSRRRGRQDHATQDLAIDRFTLESWQKPRLDKKEADLLKRAAQALAQMKSAHKEFQQKKRTRELFTRQAEDLAWENRRHAMKQKIRDIF